MRPTVFNKTRIILISLIMLIVLISCSASLPDAEPNLGMGIDLNELNKTIKVTIPKSINSYRVGSTVELEIVNLSTKNLKFRIDEIQIFRIIDDQWQKVPNKMKTIVVNDLFIEQNEVSDKDLILEPNGVFPGYKELVGVLPDVKPDEAVFLRIFVFAHYQEYENMSPNIVGAFVDVSLNP